MPGTAALALRLVMPDDADKDPCASVIHISSDTPFMSKGPSRYATQQASVDSLEGASISLNKLFCQGTAFDGVPHSPMTSEKLLP